MKKFIKKIFYVLIIVLFVILLCVILFFDKNNCVDGEIQNITNTSITLKSNETLYVIFTGECFEKVSNLKKGDEISVIYKGAVSETYPVLINNVISIKVKEEGFLNEKT